MPPHSSDVLHETGYPLRGFDTGIQWFDQGDADESGAWIDATGLSGEIAAGQ